MSGTTVTPTAGGTPTGDAAELEQKKKDLNTVKAQLDDATARTTALAAEIKVLEQRISDVKKATDAYTAAIAAQQKELDDDQKLIGQKLLMATAGVKDQIDAVDKLVKSVDDDIAEQAGKLGALRTAADKAQQAWDVAAADAKAKQDAYATIKQAQKNTDDQLKQVKALTDQAVKAEVQGDIVSMYFLLQEASKLAKSVTILSPGEYDKNVKAAQADAEAAKAKLGDRKTESDKQQKLLADAETQLTAAQSARQATILAKLKAIIAPATVPPAPAAPVSSAAPTPTTPPPGGGGH
jgi:DNA repair exonuclease SbcCD ATPase subunit